MSKNTLFMHYHHKILSILIFSINFTVFVRSLSFKPYIELSLKIKIKHWSKYIVYHFIYGNVYFRATVTYKERYLLLGMSKRSLIPICKIRKIIYFLTNSDRKLKVMLVLEKVAL